MEKMTRAEVMAQLQLGITAFEMDRSTKKDPIVSKLMSAMKDAIEYIGEVPKSETKIKTVTVKEKVHTLPEIKQVIFNYPATVVIWSDGVKTVVECQKGDNYDMEKGLAMCVCKRMMGNQSNFNKKIRKYTDDAKNVQTKKKAKEGIFEERKAVRIAQANVNAKAKGKSKAGKDIVKLIIEIDKEVYEHVRDKKFFISPWVDTAIINGTPLPKGHGRLIDADKLDTRARGNNSQRTMWREIDCIVKHAQTIVEADK